MSDFCESIVGFEDILKNVPKDHILFISESMVDKTPMEIRSDKPKVVEIQTLTLMKELRKVQEDKRGSKRCTKDDRENQVVLKQLNNSGESNNSLNQEQNKHGKIQNDSKTEKVEGVVTSQSSVKQVVSTTPNVNSPRVPPKLLPKPLKKRSKSVKHVKQQQGDNTNSNEEPEQLTLEQQCSTLDTFSGSYECFSPSPSVEASTRKGLFHSSSVSPTKGQAFAKDFGRDQSSKEEHVDEASKKSVVIYKEKGNIVEALKVAAEDSNNISQQHDKSNIQEKCKSGIIQESVPRQSSDVDLRRSEEEEVSQCSQKELGIIHMPQKLSPHYKYQLMQQHGDCSNKHYSRSNSCSNNYKQMTNCREGQRHSTSDILLDHHDNPSQGFSVATSTGDGPPLSIGIGNLIQIPGPESECPIQCGTVKWIGLLPGAIGQSAGIELVMFVSAGC